MSDYLKVIYDEESHPYTSYPMKLCAHLFDQYGMDNGMRLLEPGCGRGEFLKNFKNLGMEGFKQITVVDADSISISNTTRQLFYQERDVGKSKVKVAGEKMKLTFPGTSIQICETFINI